MGSKKTNNLEKAIDKSKNKLVTITDKGGHVKKVWKHIEGTEVAAGVNAGKSYEKTGQRHTSFEGFESGDAVTFTAGGKEISGTFRHVNQSKHSTVAVVRGEDNKLYERGLSKIAKKIETGGSDDIWTKSGNEMKAHIKTESGLKYSVSIMGHSGDKPFIMFNGVMEKVGRKNLQELKKIGEEYLNSKSGDNLQVFRNIIKASKDLNHAFELVSKMKNVKPEVSAAFKAKYASLGERPMEAFENFYNEVKGIKKESLHVETQKLDKKKNPNFGGKKEDNFTDKVDKVSWQRGDSVSYISKDGKEKLGRVVKIDTELNATTVRQANGLTETVTNRKIKA